MDTKSEEGTAEVESHSSTAVDVDSSESSLSGQVTTDQTDQTETPKVDSSESSVPAVVSNYF